MSAISTWATGGQAANTGTGMRRQAAGRGAHAAKDVCLENRKPYSHGIHPGPHGVLDSRGSIYGNSCAPPIFNTEYELVPLLGSANSSYSVLKTGCTRNWFMPLFVYWFMQTRFRVTPPQNKKLQRVILRAPRVCAPRKTVQRKMVAKTRKSRLLTRQRKSASW